MLGVLVWAVTIAGAQGHPRPGLAVLLYPVMLRDQGELVTGVKLVLTTGKAHALNLELSLTPKELLLRRI